MSASILDDWLTWVKVLIERLPKNFVIISKIFAAPPVNVIINTRKETRLETEKSKRMAEMRKRAAMLNEKIA